MNHIKETFVYTHETEELDFVWQDDLMGPSSDGQDYNVVCDERVSNEGDPISIEKLKGILDDMKERGANYVCMYGHPDHHSYVVTGITLELLSDDAVKVLKQREKEILLSQEKHKLEKTEKLIKEQKELVKKLTNGTY